MQDRCLRQNSHSTSMLRIAGIVLAAVLFLSPLGFNTLILSRGDSSFLIGFACLLFGFSYVAWFANPLFLVSVVFLSLNRSGMALATSTASLILAATTFLIQKAAYNEAGDMANVVGYGLGFYLWIASISVILLTSGLSTKAKRVIAPTPIDRNT
jgi:hypothetical protein